MLCVQERGAARNAEKIAVLQPRLIVVVCIAKSQFCNESIRGLGIDCVPHGCV